MSIGNLGGVRYMVELMRYAIADQVADEFAVFVGSSIPVLSDYAASRVGIYEEHP
ncbi:hypothetical protein QUA54_25355 [Microcoleus sp. MOSTC5]|uniref:hypothetical protein n=1 Tax=Microcoleus sp. MOSTC5 TaxID=3055378 RepID=UPI002FCFB0C3